MDLNIQQKTIRFRSLMCSPSSLFFNRAKILVLSGALSLAAGMHSALADENMYSVFQVKAISEKRILPSTTFENLNEAEKIRVVAARGEYEPVSFVVAAHQDVFDITPVLTTALRSNSDTISADNVDIRLVKRWYQGCIDSIHYKHCPLGDDRFLVPELLLKDDRLVMVDRAEKMNWLRASMPGGDTYIDITSAENSELKRGDDRSIPPNAEFDDAETLQAVSINMNENQQYWITIHVPPESPPGLYTGKILLTSKSAPDRELDIELDVLPFELDPPSLEHSIYYKGRMVEQHVDLQGVSTDLKTEEEFTRDMENMRRHGIVSTTTNQTFTSANNLYEKNLSVRRDLGMNSRIYVLWSGSYYENKDLAINLMDYAKSFGFDEVYFYGGEELSDEEWASQEAKWEFMRSIGGKVFIGKSDPDIAPIVDLAVGGLRTLTKEQAMERAEAYHQFGHRIFARSNPQVGVENADVYRRNYGMLLLALGYDGTMNYAYQDSWGSVWNDFDGYFRDHIFVYPTSHGLIDTIQWEGFREGVDDARYLSTLNNLIRVAKTTGVDVEEVEEWIRNIDYENADMDMVREDIIERILALKGLRLSSLSAPSAPSQLEAVVD